MEETLTVYVFRISAHRTVAAAAATSAVMAAFGGFGEFERYFGGSMSFGLPSNPEFLGVWGHRNAARFRRILRDRLGNITILHAAPPARHTLLSRTGPRLNRAERDAQERTFPPAPSTSVN